MRPARKPTPAAPLEEATNAMPTALAPEGGASSSLPSIGGTSELPSIGGGRQGWFSGLGGVGNRAGRFDYDEAYLKKAQAELAKLNAINEPGIGGEEEKKEDTRTML